MFITCEISHYKTLYFTFGENKSSIFKLSNLESLVSIKFRKFVKKKKNYMEICETKKIEECSFRTKN